RESLETLISYCAGCEHRELTPSDTSYAAISMEELDQLQGQYALQDVYSLSPLQEGMLYHALLQHDSEGYFEQLSYELVGSLNVSAVQKSMEWLVERHAVLRTLFLNEGYTRPLQVVLQKRAADFRYTDLTRDKQGNNSADYIRTIKKEDRQQKFDLSRDPLIRLTLVQTGFSEYTFIWSFHHIIMDGWCMAIIIRDFNTMYKHLTAGMVLEPVPVIPYARYIRWLEDRDPEPGRDFWKQYLDGFEMPTGLPGEIPVGGIYLQYSEKIILEREILAAVRQTTVSLGITSNTLIQAAWGILISRYNDTTDAMFGSVVSGRPADVPEVEEIVGLFINTIPVRVRFDADEPVSALLQRLQAEAVEAEPFHYHSLKEVQSYSIPDTELFDHILVFENYPVAKEVQQTSVTADDIVIRNAEMFEQTDFSCAVIILPGEEFTIRMDYDARRYEPLTVRVILHQLKQIIVQLTGNYQLQIGEIELADADVMQDEPSLDSAAS
ncbi:MAG: condensation domain-containing protein, partial [Bacteroidetes bacterium]|nr:condensation domain-containing protein [Bacteroidota bacterium]